FTEVDVLKRSAHERAWTENGNEAAAADAKKLVASDAHTLTAPALQRTTRSDDEGVNHSCGSGCKLHCWDVVVGGGQVYASSPQAASARSTFAEKLAQNQLHPSRRFEAEEEATAEPSRWLVYPDSTFGFCWDSLQLMCLCYTILITPYSGSFFSYEKYQAHWSHVTDRITDVYYFLDIIVHLQTPYFDVHRGELVCSRRQIARNYARGWLAFDVIVTVPWDLLLTIFHINQATGATKWTRTLRIVRVSRAAKLLRVLQFDRLFEFCEDRLGLSRNHIVVVQLLMIILLVAHFTACGFYLTGTMNEDYEKLSWIAKNKLLGVDSFEAYMTSLYWSFTMMATVGFGDIVPITFPERVFTIFAMLVSAGTYAFMIASMSATVGSLNVTKRLYYEKINEINAYMKSRELPAALQLRTRKYYRYYLQRKTVYNENRILDDLPVGLREEVTAHYIQQTIKHVLFFQNMDRAFTSMIALQLKPVFHPPQTVILCAGDIADEFFILAKGVVQVFDVLESAHGKQPSAISATTRARETTIAYLYEGDHFGEMALLLEEQQGKRSASVRATEYSELFSLEYAELQEALTKFPDALTKMMRLALSRKKLVANLHKAKIVNLVSAIQRKHCFCGNHGASRRVDHVSRFVINELVLLSHPNLLRYCGTIQTRSSLFVAHEFYASSCTLKTLLEAFGPMKESVIRRYVLQLCQALNYLHSHDVAHRNLSCESIYIDSYGMLKLGEFGLSYELQQATGFASSNELDWLVKHPPPEIKPADTKRSCWSRKSDVWSVGILVIQMMCGYGKTNIANGVNSSTKANSKIPQRARQSLTLGAATTVPTAVELPVVPSTTSKHLRTVIRSCLQTEPRKRCTIDALLQLPFFQVDPAQDTNELLRSKGIQYASTIQRLEREIAKQQHRELTPADAHRRLLLLPTSQFWTFWNSLHLCALSYICTCVPYMTALTPPTVATMIDWGDYVNRIIDVFYVLDIVVSFRAAYVHAETGELVYDSRQIARNYVHGWFFFDLAMAFPFDVLLPDSVSSSNLPFFVRILRLIRLAKLMRILKVQPLLDYCEDFLGISRNKLVVLQLVLSIFLVAHLTACGFILAATADHFFQEPFALASKQEAIAAAASSSASSSSVAQTPVTYASWIYVNDLTDAPARDIYITALYWSFTMMTTVGFGDIVPVTIVERMYTIFAMVISAGTYAYVIASMSSIVALMNLSQSRYYERINELNAYMESRQLPPGLQLRTRQFYRYYLTKKTVFDETALFDALPTNLREELVEHFIKTVIRHIAFFQDIEKAFTAHIALLLKPVFFSPQSMVIKEQDVGTEMFIISKGELQVLFLVHDDKADNKNSSEERNVAVLQDGDHFGELALLCDPAGRRRQASVRALTYCELHTLSYAHLDGGSTLERFPLVRKKLVDTASQRMALLNNLHKAKLDSLLPHHHNTTGAHGHTGMIAMLQSQLNQNIGHHLHHHHHGHHRHDGGHGQRDDEQQPAERGRGVNIFAAEIKRLSQVELALFTPSTDSTRVPHSLSSTSSSWLSSAHLLRPSSNSCTSRRQLPIDAEAFPAEQTHL
ncbi:TPA: hypothetical protein N0F65_012710, partial [Lagenidium giganteum]